LDKKNVVGALTEGWLAFVRKIAETRAGGVDVSPKEFAEPLQKHEVYLQELKASADPARAQREADLLAIKKEAALGSRLQKNVNEAVTQAISQGKMTGEQCAQMVASVCTALKQPMPRLIGLDAESCTVKQTHAFVNALVARHRFDVVRDLHALLTKVVDGLDRAQGARSEVTETLKMTGTEG
jgi:hypothetical protein